MPSPLTLRQPVPDVPSMRDVLVEASLQERCSILELTTAATRQRAQLPVLRARTACVVVAHDTLGYSFRDIAKFMNRSLSTVVHLYGVTNPRLRLNEDRYPRLLKHLGLFARGLPTTRLDLAGHRKNVSPLVPEIMALSLPGPQKLLRLWLVQHMDPDGTVSLDDKAEVARVVGIRPSVVNAMLANALAIGILAVDEAGVYRVDTTEVVKGEMRGVVVARAMERHS